MGCPEPRRCPGHPEPDHRYIGRSYISIFSLFPSFIVLAKKFHGSFAMFFSASQFTTTPYYQFIHICQFKTGHSARRAIFFLILQNEMIFYHNQINFFFRKGNRRETE
jgi:hypothetical protein